MITYRDLLAQLQALGAADLERPARVAITVQHLAVLRVEEESGMLVLDTGVHWAETTAGCE